MSQKCKYLKDYLKLGFTILMHNGIAKPQCALCRVVLSAESMKLSKFKCHLKTKQHVRKRLGVF